MSSSSEQFERDISRQIDGELSPAAEAAMYRAILRDPAARQLADDTRRVDGLAGVALRSMFGGTTQQSQQVAERIVALEQHRPVAAHQRWRWPLAAAAGLAIAATLGFWSLGQPNAGNQNGEGTNVARVTSPTSTPSGLLATDSAIRIEPAMDFGPAFSANSSGIGAGYLGVVDETTDTVYWLLIETPTPENEPTDF